MARGSENRFRFTLGRAGFAFFVSAIAALLLVSFLFGVMVGRNMDTYPRKIAQEIPAAISKKIAGVIQGEGEPPPAQEPEKKKEDPSFQYRFFETLTEPKSPPAAEPKTPAAVKTPVVVKAPAAPPETAGAESPASPAGRYGVQVASFRDRDRAGKVLKELESLGLSPVIDPVDLKSRGTWYRIRLHGFPSYEEAKAAAAAAEKRLTGTRCIIRKEQP